jgi:hypothetical protein
VRRLLAALGDIGLDDDRVLELEQLLAVDERGGFGRSGSPRIAQPSGRS